MDFRPVRHYQVLGSCLLEYKEGTKQVLLLFCRTHFTSSYPLKPKSNKQKTISMKSVLDKHHQSTPIPRDEPEVVLNGIPGPEIDPERIPMTPTKVPCRLRSGMYSVCDNF